ncbi:MAG: hypothetical protein KGD66_00650 [Candidatus Lokiarchaeota archaeon]|nr:hypothetical protein [Candidatus Lokiarchaeota archaeon]
MLKTYIFNEVKNSWIEEEHVLLFHDLCVFLDVTQKKAFLWNGPKSTKDKLEKGKDSLINIFSSFQDSDLQLIILSKDLPSHIKSKLENMLETAQHEEDAEKYVFTKFITIRLYFVMSLISLILPTLMMLNLWGSLYWLQIGSNVSISSINFLNWINFAKIMVSFTLIALLINIGVSIYEYEITALINSLSGIIISIGMIVYLQQGIFLFLFQVGSTESLYLINFADLIRFLIITTICSCIFEIPNLAKLISFIKTYKTFIF